MKKLLLAGVMCLVAGTVLAGDLLQWQDNSLTFLYGTDFDLDPETQETLTFEHVSGWGFGDLFIFVDAIYFDGDVDFKNDDWSYYGEIAPRLSASKILDKDLSMLFIKDFLIAGCYEGGKNSDDNALIGPAVDLDIPGFDFLQLNLYRRFNDLSSSPEAYQLTPVWKISVPVGSSSIVFDGFIDWVFGDSSRNLHICPQIKLDVGSLIGMDAGSLYAGIEYDYWKNKYGVKNVDQTAVSGIIKYHF